MSELFPTGPVDDPERRFGGIRRLYGGDSLARLSRARVCVIGIGGVGSWTAEALARSGVGRLTLIDPDHVAESNVNRQTHALESTLGMAKVQAMAARIRDIHPSCRVDAWEEQVSEANVARLLAEGYDAVVDAIDDVQAKAALVAYGRDRGQFLVCVGGAGGRRDPLRLRAGDLAHSSHDPLLARLRALLRGRYSFPRAPGVPFGVPCVYSTEAVMRPHTGVCDERPADGRLHGLNCAGYGSSVCVTAAFGLVAAALVMERLQGHSSGYAAQ
ncbi:MAG: tRNA threonylcarbamoyladenosine dehydratase [Thiobacillaceae bacterium]|nr:tRNA threonylcarbamoyladenosine dehydratase [Thiobacillaceae bacterium]MCX7672162.1 tRNA threonylcarbamoyladenosine dehydratase [Thiobacillaceae bacterium]MDW8323879.1 tRNA threonylcarbamoyladenosine dehydratase [Burkholderiales bacterium]